ncbi:AAA family ATPase [Deltaproteobacteria bacterium Smac51]|nr:AAA family ATPase [Deltaproteobacteria bacterium Smac51]
MIKSSRINGLGRDMEWFGRVINNRLITLGLHDGEPEPEEPPILLDGDSYGDLARRHALSVNERLVLILALLPHVKPDFLNGILLDDNGARIFGGHKSASFNGFLPTVQTALAVVGGSRFTGQVEAFSLFSEKDGRLIRGGLLRLGSCPPGEPRLSAPLILDEEVFSLLILGEPYEPTGYDFVHRLETGLQWDELILPVPVLRQLDDILYWVSDGWRVIGELGLGKHLRPGYKALFYGPPGTGKTLTAALIGQTVGRPVYRVDLSQIVSKYIGETEKNLEQLFRLAEGRDWILFFDEADALFHKRTEVEDAHDRHANQQTAYLLQRLENFPNLVIMATNLQDNIDSAFTRRFNCGVFFPMPGRRERAALWASCLGDKLRPTDEALALLPDFELSGGQITNIALRLALWALRNGLFEVSADMAKRAVMLEMTLQGRA